jgi:hypothetical protein
MKISQEGCKDTRKNERKKDTVDKRYDSRKRKTTTNRDREEEGGKKLRSEMENQVITVTCCTLACCGYCYYRGLPHDSAPQTSPTRGKPIQIA